MLKSKDWSLKTESNNEDDTCVHIFINEDINIEGLVLTLLDQERKIITEMKVTSHEVYMCVSLATPEFIKLGDCVKYVDGSGYETYHLEKVTKNFNI